MAKATFRDLTESEVLFLQALAAEVLDNNNLLITQNSLNTFTGNFQNALNGTMPVEKAEISSGTLTINRKGWFQIVEVDTEGQTSTDTMNELLAKEATNDFRGGDTVFLKQVSQAKSFTVEENSGKNILMGSGSFLIRGDGYILALVFDELSSKFVDMGRHPLNTGLNLDKILLNNETIRVSAGTLTVTKAYVNAGSELAAETLATATVKIDTTPGSSGTITVFVDEGNGAFSIGTTSYTSASTPNAQAALLETDIDAGPSYTAAVTTDTVTVTAPAGTGSSANAFILTVIVINITSTVVTFPVVTGVDGTDQDDDIATISGMVTNQIIYLENDMGTKTLTFIAGGNIATRLQGFILKAGCIIALTFNGTDILLAQNDIGRHTWSYHNYFNNVTPAKPSGTFNSLTVVPVLTYLQDNINGWVWTAANNTGILFVHRLHDNFIGSSIVVSSNLIKGGTGTGDVYFHLGHRYIENGLIMNESSTPYTFVNITETLPVPNNEEMFLMEEKIADPLFAAKGIVVILLFRESGNGADTFADDVHGVDITLSYNIEITP